MMRTKILLLLAPMVILTAAVAWAQQETEPGAGMAGTHHDFTTATGIEFQADVGLCTFCHTPHKATMQRLIWNRELVDQQYTWGSVTHTIGGTELPTIDTSWTGPSRFCLSCHDGSVAFGAIRWFDKADWRTTPISSASNQTMQQHQNHLIGFEGSMAGNHPVAHPYPFGQVVNTYNGSQTGPEVPTGEFVADPAIYGIRLFNDNTTVVTAGAVQGSTGIECSSCHDPHNGSTVQDHYFLRGKLKGSTGPAADGYICLKCHRK